MADDLEENFVIDNEPFLHGEDGEEVEGEIVEQKDINDYLSENEDKPETKPVNFAELAHNKRLRLLEEVENENIKKRALKEGNKDGEPKSKKEKQNHVKVKKSMKNKNIIEQLAEHEFIPDIVSEGEKIDELFNDTVELEIFQNTKNKKLAKIDLEAIIIAPSAERSIEIIKSLKENIIPNKIHNKERCKTVSKIIKLWSRHIKPKEQLELINRRESLFGVGTPNRIYKLFTLNGFSICKRLKFIIIDLSYLDSKSRKMLDIPEVEKDLWELLNYIKKCKSNEDTEKDDEKDILIDKDVCKNVKVVII